MRTRLTLLLLLLAALLCTGCHGQLVAALEERQAASCIYWRTPFASGVTSTGNADLSACMAHPCPCQLR